MNNSTQQPTNRQGLRFRGAFLVTGATAAMLAMATGSSPAPATGQAGGSNPDLASTTVPKTLPASHPAARRALELVKVLNGVSKDEERQFIASSWRLSPTDTIDAVSQTLNDIRERVGENIGLESVEAGSNGEVLAQVRSAKRRETTLHLLVEAQAPYRLSVEEVERGGFTPTTDEMTPKIAQIETSAVTVPLSFERGRPFVDVMLEGKGPFRFMVETGSRYVIVTPKVANAVKDKLRVIDNNKLFRVGKDPVDSAYGVNDLRIGGARFSNFMARVAPKQPGVDGVLGLPIFKSLLMTVNYPKGILRLEKGALPKPDGKQIFPIHQDSASLWEMDLNVGGKRLPFVIDTQSVFGFQLTPRAAEGMPFQAPPVLVASMITGQRHVSPVLMARLAEDLKYGAFTFKNPLIRISSSSDNPDEASNIGTEVLSHFVMTLDQQTKRVRFLREGPKVIAASPSYRSFGAKVAEIKGGGLKIASVELTGAAARAGLKEGDVLVRVGDLKADAIVGTLDRLAQTTDPVTFEVLRDGQPVTLTIRSDVVVK